MRDAREVGHRGAGGEAEEREVQRDGDEHRHDGERRALDDVVGAPHGGAVYFCWMLVRLTLESELNGPCGDVTMPVQFEP